jgi:hypothetical protein
MCLLQELHFYFITAIPLLATFCYFLTLSHIIIYTHVLNQ